MRHNISLLLSLVLLCGCDGFLDRYPQDQNSSETMFSSATLAESVVTGAYSNLCFDYTSSDKAVLNWDSFSSVLDPQEGFINQNYTYLTGTIQPNHSMFLSYWKRFYEGINRANDVINNIGNVPNMSAELKAQRIAECTFLRAYQYYRLNALWRGVPIYEENLAPTEYTKARSSEEDVWKFIVEQCTKVIDCEQIPNRYAPSSQDYGRVTKAAAYTLRGKAYLWLKEWAKAETDFLAVGACGHELFDNYAELFTEPNEKCAEMIFSVQMIQEANNGNSFSNNYGNYCTTGYGKYHHYLNTNFIDSFEEANGKAFSWDNYFEGYSSMTPSERSVFFLRNHINDSEKASMASKGADMSKYKDADNETGVRNAFAGRDPRLAAIAITPYSTYIGGASGAVATYTNRYPYRDWQDPSLDLRYGNNQYLLYPIRKFVAVGRNYTNIEYNPVDVPIYRYADVLLCLAEAINEQGRFQDALPFINDVRKRAGVALLSTNATEANMKVSNSDDLRIRIQKEKHWELACEEVIFFDELRWGTWHNTKFAQGNGLLNVWGEPVYKYIWGGNAFYKWAIPQSEVEKNRNLVQNEDWK